MRKFERDDQNQIVCDEEPDPSWLKDIVSRPPNFGYSGDNDQMFETWSLGPVIETRDSTLLDKANAAALKRFLDSDSSLTNQWSIEHCRHWAVGWVDHLSFRVYEDEEQTKPTRIARILFAWFAYLEDHYPVADEDLYSEMESEATHKWLKQEGRHQAARLDYVLPDDWYERVVDWWDTHDQSALENRDDNGACPSDEQWRAAFEGCEFKKEEEDDMHDGG